MQSWNTIPVHVHRTPAFHAISRRGDGCREKNSSFCTRNANPHPVWFQPNPCERDVSVTGGSRGHRWKGPAGAVEPCSQVSSEETAIYTLGTACWGWVTAPGAGSGRGTGQRTPAGFHLESYRLGGPSVTWAHMPLQQRPDLALLLMWEAPNQPNSGGLILPTLAEEKPCQSVGGLLTKSLS